MHPTDEHPKPYGFVPLAPRVERRSVPGHDTMLRDHYQGVVQLAIETLQPLHIGTGMLRVADGGALVYAFQRAAHQLVLPGAGIKGAIRSIAEAVSCSCAPGQPCKPSEMCPTCGLFGVLGRKGRVGFGEFTAPEETRTDHQRLPQLYAPRLNRNAERNAPGRKFYYHGKQVDTVAASGKLVYEVAPKGTRFSGEVRLSYLTEPELKLLFFAMGLDQSFAPKLGYGKPAYLGSVQFAITAAALRRGREPVPDAASWLQGLAQQYGQTADQRAPSIQALRTILTIDPPAGPAWRQDTGGY